MNLFCRFLCILEALIHSIMISDQVKDIKGHVLHALKKISIKN